MFFILPPAFTASISNVTPFPFDLLEAARTPDWGWYARFDRWRLAQLPGRLAIPAQAIRRTLRGLSPIQARRQKRRAWLRAIRSAA